MKTKTVAIHNSVCAVTGCITLVCALRASALRAEELPIDLHAESSFKAHIGGDYAISRSDHFILLHDLRPEKARELLVRLELAYSAVCQLTATNGLETLPIQKRLQVVCASNRADQLSLVHPLLIGQSGHYDRNSKVSYFHWIKTNVPTMKCDRGPDSLAGEATYITAQHETVHQVIDHLCPDLNHNMPSWLAEGIACSFEGDLNAQFAYRALNKLRADDLIRMLSAERKIQGVAKNPPVRIRAVMNEADLNWHVISDNGFPLQRESMKTQVRRARWYAVSWATVFYLEREQPEKFKQLLHALNKEILGDSKAKIAKIIKDTIGPVDDEFERAVFDLIKREMVDKAVSFPIDGN